MNKLIKLSTFIAYFAVAVFSTNASAVTVIDFSTGLAGPGGTISSVGTSIVGSGILIGALAVEGAPAPGVDGVYEAEALLNFDTAAKTISIVGTVPTLFGGSATLLDGSLDSFSYTADAFGNEIFMGVGSDTMADSLLTALGLPTGTPFHFVGFSIEAANGNVVSTDIVNTAVPLPAAVWLFGAGLLGLVGVARRRA